MGKRITIIQGHPDPQEARLCHAIGWACAEGATAAGHVVRTIDVAKLDFPLLRTRREFESGEVPPAIHLALSGIRPDPRHAVRLGRGCQAREERAVARRGAAARPRGTVV